MSYRIEELEMGAAIIECLAIGRPDREHLKLSFLIFDIGHLVLGHIIGYQVAHSVKYLDFIEVAGMEALTGLIRGIDDQREPRVPGRIDAGREDGVVAHIGLTQLAIIGNHSTPMELTGMELHATGVVLLVVVTIDALTCGFLTTKHIVDHHLLLVILQTTLVQGQFLIGHIARRDESITQIRIDAIARNGNMEGLVSPPLLIKLDKHLDIDILLTADGLVDQLAPIVHLGLYSLTTKHQFIITHRKPCHHLVTGILHLECQRSDIHRYRYVGIVRIDRRRPFDVSKLSGHRNVVTGGQEKDE